MGAVFRFSEFILRLECDNKMEGLQQIDGEFETIL